MAQKKTLPVELFCSTPNQHQRKKTERMEHNEKKCRKLFVDFCCTKSNKKWHMHGKSEYKKAEVRYKLPDYIIVTRRKLHYYSVFNSLSRSMHSSFASFDARGREASL